MHSSVPFVTRIDNSVPALVGCDDTKLFQIAVTMLSMVVTRTETGVIVLRAWMDSSRLLLSIANPSEMTRATVSWDREDSLLDLISRLVASMSGEFEYWGQRENMRECQPEYVFKVVVPAEVRASDDLGNNAFTGDLSVLNADPHEAFLDDIVLTETEDNGGTFPRPLPGAPRKKKALIIDDSLIVRKSIGRALERLGYEVKLAVDGEEGLTYLK